MSVSANLIARSSEGVRFFATLSGRTRRALLLVVFTVCYVLAASYHTITWQRGEPAGLVWTLLYNLDVIVCYGALWLLLSDIFKQRRSSPNRVFWSLLLLGLFLIGLGRLVSAIGGSVSLGFATGDVVGFDHETGVPLVLTTVVKMNVLGPLETAFAFALLLRFRNLAQFKRTRRSLRNWYAMLGLMAVVSLLTLMKPAGEDLGWLNLALIPVVGLMVVNAFRVSWIVYLSFWEKLALIGLSVMLLVLLSAGLALGYGGQGESGSYLQYYSYPLSLFSTLAVVFGILYSVTAFLSLLFHLPTTGDFQRKAGEMAAMHSLTNLVGQVFDAQKLAATIAASPIEAGAGGAAWLALADPQSGSLRPRVAATHGITAAQVAETVDTAALYADVQARGGRLLLEEAPVDHRVEARSGSNVGSLLVMPLLARNEMLGALFVAHEVPHGFEKDDVEAIEVFAAQAALALDNAHLFEERIERERLTRELDIARDVQQRLLPQTLPHLDGVSLAAASVAAQEVGGDYYDFVTLADDRIAFIVGDVSGKGTSAAFYMAELQGIFQSVSRLAPSPVDFLTHANAALASSLERNVFISVIYGVLDLKREELVLARAGHCPAATIDLGGKARFLRSKGIGLGLDRGSLFRTTLDEERVRLQPGDVFVLYTDGVVESRSAGGEEYGYDRLLTALREHRHEDADALHHALLEDLHTFIGHETYDDDMTLVVLKWHGHLSADVRPVATASQTVDGAAPGSGTSGGAGALRRQKTPLE